MGGFTTILALPNTKPVIDCADGKITCIIIAKEWHRSCIQIGAVQKDRQEKNLPKLKKWQLPGGDFFRHSSEDGKSVMNAGLDKEAMKIDAECIIRYLHTVR